MISKCEIISYIFYFKCIKWKQFFYVAEITSLSPKNGTKEKILNTNTLFTSENETVSAHFTFQFYFLVDGWLVGRLAG